MKAARDFTRAHESFRAHESLIGCSSLLIIVYETWQERMSVDEIIRDLMKNTRVLMRVDGN